MKHGIKYEAWGAAKRFAINERHNVQLRAEFFIFPNHPNWQDFNIDARSSSLLKYSVVCRLPTALQWQGD